MTTSGPAMKISGFAKAMMRFQAFMLRRNWMGAMGDFIMVITVRGRKSGRSYSTPIAYLRDGADIIALNPRGTSNWFRNILVNPDVELNVRGETLRARAEHITDQAEIERLFELYKQDGRAFERLFDLPLNSSPEKLAEARDLRQFVRFRRV